MAVNPPVSESTADRWIGALAGCVVPVATALAFALYIVEPRSLPEDFPKWAALLLLAELPLALIGGIFAGVAAIPGPAWRRVLIYLIVLALVCAAGGLWQLFNDDQIGAILAWAVAGHVLGLIWLGPNPELSATRADAIASDAASQVVLTGWSLVVVAVLLVIYSHTVVGDIENGPWRMVLWVGVGHFLLRARSIVHAYGADFIETRRAYLDRPWVHWLTHNLGRSGSSGDHD